MQEAGKPTLAEVCICPRLHHHLTQPRHQAALPSCTTIHSPLPWCHQATLSCPNNSSCAVLNPPGTWLHSGMRGWFASCGRAPSATKQVERMCQAGQHHSLSSWRMLQLHLAPLPPETPALPCTGCAAAWGPAAAGGLTARGCPTRPGCPGAPRLTFPANVWAESYQ